LALVVNLIAVVRNKACPYAISALIVSILTCGLVGLYFVFVIFMMSCR
jgi:hypothetical protein